MPSLNGLCCYQSWCHEGGDQIFRLLFESGVDSFDYAHSSRCLKRCRAMTSAQDAVCSAMGATCGSQHARRAVKL